MKPKFLHIIKAGSSEQLDFTSPLNALAKGTGKPDLGHYFTASGSFGTVQYEQFDFPTVRLLDIRLEVNDQIEITFKGDEQNISMFYCDSGYIVLRKNELPKKFVAQTQIGTIHSLNSEIYSIIVPPVKNKPCNLFHICVPITANSSEISISINAVKKYLQKFKNSSSDVLIFQSTMDTQKGFFSIWQELGKEKPNIPVIQSYTEILLIETLRCFEVWRLTENTSDRWDPEVTAVYSMAEMIILGMDEPWTINKFTSSQHLNSNKIKILFKKHMGMPASEFRISVRMQKAAQLLRETKISIQEISALVGYTNPAQFSTMFKRKIGCTPKQARHE